MAPGLQVGIILWGGEVSRVDTAWPYKGRSRAGFAATRPGLPPPLSREGGLGSGESPVCSRSTGVNKNTEEAV